MDKIICVGKNYIKHALELGDAVPTEPLYFLKPPSTRLESSTELELVRGDEVHHELELVFKISRIGQNFQFSHYTLGLDLTLRALQTRLKKSGQPWEKAKVFKNSAVLGAWQPLHSLEEVLNLEFRLKVNAETRQVGKGQDMRWQPAELLADIQKWFPVCDGDVLFTGTPEGVGPLKVGDRLHVEGGPVRFDLTCV